MCKNIRNRDNPDDIICVISQVLKRSLQSHRRLRTTGNLNVMCCLDSSYAKLCGRTQEESTWMCTSWSSWPPACWSADLPRSNGKNSSIIRPNVGTCGGEKNQVKEAATQNPLYAESNCCVVANTFRSSDNMDALSCSNASLNICWAVGSWDYNICRSGQNGWCQQHYILQDTFFFWKMKWFVQNVTFCGWCGTFNDLNTLPVVVTILCTYTPAFCRKLTGRLPAELEPAMPMPTWRGIMGTGVDWIGLTLATGLSSGLAVGRLKIWGLNSWDARTFSNNCD